MPKLEFKRKSELSRKEVSERLIALGQALADGSEAELGSDGDSLSILVADRVRWELELEVDGDEVELEIEISWRDAPAGKPADDAGAAAKPADRAESAPRTRPKKSTKK